MAKRRIPTRLRQAVVYGKNPTLEQALEPAKGATYPERMIGSRTKVPSEHYGNWGLYSAVRQSVSGKFTRAQVKNALLERSKREYDAEWATAAKKSAEAKRVAVQKAKTGMVQEVKQTTAEKMAQWAVDIRKNITRANYVNARLISPDLKRRIFANGSAKIMDLGSGKGLTILPVIGRMSSFERARTEVYLVDVSVVDMQEAKRELVKLGVVPKNVHIIKSNFASFAINKKLKALAGQVDIVTSGAALHHLSKSELLFRQVTKLLKKDGAFTFWDWGHPAWRAPNLVVAPEGAKVSAIGDSYVLNGRKIKAPELSAFISQEIYSHKKPTHRTPQELAATKEMLSTWISLLNFPETEVQRFKQYFDERVQRGEPIAFGNYLKRLQTIQPSVPAQIMIMESHKPAELYLRALEKSGMRSTRDPHYITKSNLLYSITAKRN